MDPKEIRNLVKSAKSGNVNAFGELYEMYSGEMYAFANYYLGDKYRAEDAVSDAVCSAFSSVRTLKEPNAFKPWIFKILLRACQKQLKHIIRQRETKELTDLSDKVHKDYIDEKIALKQALLTLNNTDRSIVLLSTVGKYNSREIGEMLDMLPSTVRSRLSRATDKLYSFLSEEGEKTDE